MPNFSTNNLNGYTPYDSNPDGADGEIHGNDPSAVNNRKGLGLSIFAILMSGAGRVGFYEDYSERTTPGIHTFSVQRTHGSSGSVSVDYTSSGDDHTVISGTFTWANGENGVKSITCDVPAKSIDGDHRILLTLSNPTGGAVLQKGATHTTAVGVIDDGTVAPESLALYYSEGDGGTNSGTFANPYNNIYDAIANIGSKRYLYGKGVTIPDGTNTFAPGGSDPGNLIFIPATRSGESTRLYIQAWPGNTWTITGGAATNVAGFYAYQGESYHTYRGIDFSSLDTSGQTNINGWGIFYHYGSSSGINIEHCTADDINGATGNNNGAYMLWQVNGGKVWRSTSNNIQTAGDNTNANTAGVYTYLGQNVTIQRCNFTNSYNGIFHKRVASVGAVSFSASFNHFENSIGVYYGVAAGTDRGHSYGVIQSNIFEGCDQGGVVLGMGGTPASECVDVFHLSNNVFDACGSSDIGAVHMTRGFGAVIFNNIMYNCRRVWVDYVDHSGIGAAVKLGDYNLEFGTTNPTIRYGYTGIDYSTATALFAAHGFANNDVEADPLFTDAVNDDYTLGVGSPGLTGGVDGTEQGLYLTGVEVIGV